MLGCAFNLQIENELNTFREFLAGSFCSFLQTALHHGKRSNTNTDSAVQERIVFKEICGFLAVSFWSELYRFLLFYWDAYSYIHTLSISHKHTFMIISWRCNCSLSMFNLAGLMVLLSLILSSLLMCFLLRASSALLYIYTLCFIYLLFFLMNFN